MKKRIHLLVRGRVQGVFFRANTVKKAKELGVKGWVKNLEDGRVEVVGEGEEEKLKELVGFCQRGDFGAKVEKVEVRWEEFKGEFKGFGRIFSKVL